MILPIVTVPDPILRKKSKPVEHVDDDLRRLMDDMLETMYEAPGIGLAAIQVGIDRRVLLIDLQTDKVKAPQFFVNPEIVWESEELRVYNEGCLSVPEQYVEIERPNRIRARWLDYYGKSCEAEMEGLMATCLQHEIDHLNGVLLVDYLSRLKRNMIIRRLKKAKNGVRL